MILGFTGWMDGGEVSTGTVDYFAAKFEAAKIAEIDPSPFYIYNFPGSMEVAALFRPQVEIRDGLIVDFSEPASQFYCSATHRLVLFAGREPNLAWREYAEALFALASQMRVRHMYFVGSVAGTVPHTRDPRVYVSVSDKEMMTAMRRHGLQPSNYEGPGSFITYLTTLARDRGIEMASIVVETPAYVQGRNIRCVETVIRKLVAVADIPLDYSDLTAASREFVERLNEIVEARPDLAELIHRMEEDYDQQASQSASDEIKAWLERQGIRLD